MSSINGINGSSPIQQPTNVSASRSASAPPAQAGRSADRLELSGAGHLLKSLKANTDVRADKIASIRSQIEAGTYEDEAKMNVVVDRLLDEVL